MSPVQKRVLAHWVVLYGASALLIINAVLVLLTGLVSALWLSALIAAAQFNESMSYLRWRRRRRPDYGLIARLEHELGIGQEDRRNAVRIAARSVIPDDKAYLVGDRPRLRAPSRHAKRWEYARGWHPGYVGRPLPIVHTRGRLPSGERWQRLGAMIYLVDDSGIVLTGGHHRLWRDAQWRLRGSIGPWSGEVVVGPVGMQLRSPLEDEDIGAQEKGRLRELRMEQDRLSAELSYAMWSARYDK